MKKIIKRSIAVIMCLPSLLLCCCGEQQQGKSEDHRSVRAVTQEPIIKGTWKEGITYQYNEETASLTVSGKIIDGVNIYYWQKDETPWGRWREDAKELILEEGVECVTGGAFREFRNLEKIVFPDTLKKIGSYAFYDSIRKIKNLVLPDSIEEIGDCALALDHTSGIGFEKIRLPKKLRSIGDLAFTSQAMTSITIPENVESMEDYIFEDCVLLEKVIIKSKKLKSVDGGVFLHTNEDLKVYVPKGLEEKYRRKLGGIDDEQVYPMKDK